jgi:hypothetical protein
MKLLLLPISIALASAASGACGGDASPRSTVRAAAGNTTFARAPPVAVVPSGRYLNDGDAERVDDQDQDDHGIVRDDTDGDSSEEYEQTGEGSRYRDRDDRDALAYGRVAGHAEARAIAAVVNRYFAAARAGDGAAACSAMASSFAKAAPDVYAGRAGPFYLRGAKSCRAVMSLAFAHFRSQLSGAVVVTGVRVDGDGHAIAFLGSRTMPASAIAVNLERGRWKVSSLLGNALP